MLYTQPNTMKSISEETTREDYNFKEVETLGLARLVSIGGEDTLSPMKMDRVLIINEGRAFAKIAGKHVDLTDGDVLEIPMGTELVINGFYKATLIQAK